MNAKRLLTTLAALMGILALAAAPAHAVLIGNSLTARANATDGALGVLNLHDEMPIPASGLINTVSIWKQEADTNKSFNLLLLRPTGVPNQYTCINSSGPVRALGATGQAQAYALPKGPMPVLAGDLFATQGQGIPWTLLSPGAWEPIYYPAATINPGDTVTLPNPPTFTYHSDRNYASAVNLVPLPQVQPNGQYGNPLVPRANATDTAAGIFEVYTDSPFLNWGMVTSVSIFQQTTGRAFELFFLRPQGNGQFLITGSSGLITTAGGTDLVQTYLLPKGPMAVEAGDLFAHYGGGIPFDILDSGTEPLYYPVASMPGVGSLISLGSAAFPFFYQERRYSLAVNVLPEPATLTLLGLGALGLAARRRRQR